MSELILCKEYNKLESWLYQITRNIIIGHYRSKQAIEELPDWIEQAQPEEEDIIKRVLLSCLEPMVKELPDKYRRAIQMSEMENKTQKEVAEQENISLSRSGLLPALVWIVAGWQPFGWSVGQRCLSP